MSSRSFMAIKGGRKKNIPVMGVFAALDENGEGCTWCSPLQECTQEILDRFGGADGLREFFETYVDKVMPSTAGHKCWVRKLEEVVINPAGV